MQRYIYIWENASFYVIYMGKVSSYWKIECTSQAIQSLF